MVSAGHVGGTRGSGIVYSAADVLWMSVVRGMRGVGGVCAWLGVAWVERGVQGVHLAVAHSLVSIGNFGGLLDGISMVAQLAGENKIDFMVVGEFIIFCAIKHHSGSPITIGNPIW